MLVLTRKLQQGLVVGDDVVIKVLGVKSGQVRLGIEAPKSVKVHRSEVLSSLEEPEGQAASDAVEDADSELTEANRL